MALSRKQVFEIIDMVKTDLGIGDYEFTLATTDKKEIYSASCGDEALAEFDMNIYEKTAKLKLDPDLKKKDDEFIRRTILHEMVHGRFNVMEKKVDAKAEQVEYEEEEDLVNDLVRLLTRGNFNW